MEVRRRRQAGANSILPLRQGHVPQGPAAEHQAVEQGPGGDSEASARRGVAVSDADREPAAQVRDRAAQRNLNSAFAVAQSSISLTAIWPFLVIQPFPLIHQFTFLLPFPPEEDEV